MRSKVISVICCFMISLITLGQTGKKTESFKVYGNCDMCKSTIEGSLKKKDGILSKKWDKETKILSVTYDQSKITIKQIGEKVAGVGYDNEYATAKNESYDKLHGCCKYERPKNK